MPAFDYANAGEVERTGLEPPDSYREPPTLIKNEARFREC